MSRASSDDDRATRESDDTDEGVYAQDEAASSDARGRRLRRLRQAKVATLPKETGVTTRSQRKTPGKGKRAVPPKASPQAEASELPAGETAAADEAAVLSVEEAEQATATEPPEGWGMTFALLSHLEARAARLGESSAFDHRGLSNDIGKWRQMVIRTKAKDPDALAVRLVIQGWNRLVETAERSQEAAARGATPLT